MPHSQLPNLAKLMRTKAVRLSEANGLKPKLSIRIAALYVDVEGLIPFIAKEEESKSLDSQDCRHGDIWSCPR
jgi:hypothetical protein